MGRQWDNVIPRAVAVHGKLTAHNALQVAHKMSSQKNMTMACEGFLADEQFPVRNMAIIQNLICLARLIVFRKVSRVYHFRNVPNIQPVWSFTHIAVAKSFDKTDASLLQGKRPFGRGEYAPTHRPDTCTER